MTYHDFLIAHQMYNLVHYSTLHCYDEQHCVFKVCVWGGGMIWSGVMLGQRMSKGEVQWEGADE